MQIDMQKLVDTLSDSARNIRKEYHLTLGKLIDFLNEQDASLTVRIDAETYPGDLGSYRGYYSDLAFKPHGKTVAAGVLLDRCKDALNATFEGYKGGEFAMGPDTPLWVSPYGINSGTAIIDIEHIGDELVLKTKQLSAF